MNRENLMKRFGHIASILAAICTTTGKFHLHSAYVIRETGDQIDIIIWAKVDEDDTAITVFSKMMYDFSEERIFDLEREAVEAMCAFNYEEAVENYRRGYENA